MRDALSWLTPPCVMGILNATPDSFSDGGEHTSPREIRTRLADVFAEGAAICDVGAESTRPGAQPVALGEELRRLEPVFAAMASGGVGPVSIDTTKAAVAACAIDAGAVLVNDITAGLGDPEMFDLVAERGVAVCLMHMRGTPRTMQEAPRYNDVVAEVATFLEERLAVAVSRGIPESRILLDPGLGFGKRLEDNMALLRGIPRLANIGRPLVVGVSRKSFVGKVLGRDDPAQRVAGSLVAGLRSVLDGAAVLRVHDVGQTVDAIAMWRAIEESV